MWTPAGPEPSAHRPAATATDPRLRAAGAARRSPPRARRSRPAILPSPCCPSTTCRAIPAATSIADGIVEEITATLSRVRDFTVIARNSAYAAFATRAKDLREVSRDLGVRYVLEGSLRKAGDRVRVTAQLIDADNGTHLWADSYDGVVDNIFDFEDQIAERVAGALHPSIRAAEIEQARRKRPESLAAYDLVLRALPHLWAPPRRATMPRPSGCSTRRTASTPATAAPRPSPPGRGRSRSSTTGPTTSPSCARRATG